MFDTTPPTITTLSPVDDISHVFPIGVLSVKFDENISAGGGSVVIKKYSDDSVVLYQGSGFTRNEVVDAPLSKRPTSRSAASATPCRDSTL